MDAPRTPRRPHRLIRAQVVRDRTGFGKSWIYSLIAAGKFPKPISLGDRAVAWLESDIDAWIQTKIDAATGR